MSSDQRNFDELNFPSKGTGSGLDPIDVSQDDILDLTNEIEALKAAKSTDMDHLGTDDDLLSMDLEGPLARPRAKKRRTSPVLFLVALLLAGGAGAAFYVSQMKSSGMIAPSAPMPVQSPETAGLPPAPDVPASGDLAVPTPVQGAEAVPPTAMGDFPPLPEAPANANEAAAGGASAPELAASPQKTDQAIASSVPPKTEPAASDLPKGDEAVKAESAPTPAAPMPEPEPIKVPGPVAAAPMPEPIATPKVDEPALKPVLEKEQSAPDVAKVEPKVAPKSEPKPEPKAAPAVPDVKPVTKIEPAPKKEPTPKIADKKKTADKVAPPAAPAAVPADMVEDEFIAQNDALDEMNKQGRRELVLTPSQKANNLGVEVGKPAAPTPQAQIEAAFRALDLERYQAAYDMFTDLYKTNGRDERVLMGRAVALQKMGRDAEALGVYDELLNLSPDNPDVMTNMLGLVRKQNPSAALQRLMELRTRYPNNPMIAAQAGLASAGMGNYKDGLSYLNIAVGLQPDNPNHYFNMAIMAEKMGNISLAISNYEKALQVAAMDSTGRYPISREMIYDRLSILRQSSH